MVGKSDQSLIGVFLLHYLANNFGIILKLKI